MPYRVRKYGNKWAVFKEVSRGKWVKDSVHDSKEKAEKSRSLKEGIKRGWQPTGKKR